MKLIIYSLFLVSFVCGCKGSFQVFETETTNTSKENGFYIYETDTFKVTYSFWAKKGVLSFEIFNKLDKPIYIDWKKSSYIRNSSKFNYWIDEEFIRAASYYRSYFYDGPVLMPKYQLNEGIGASVSSILKPERITFIPPKSSYYRSQFYLLPMLYYPLDSAVYIEVDRNDKPNKKTRMYINNYSKANSPLIFRNFIALSTTEDFENEFFLDNEFYLSKILEMEYRHFKYKERDKDGQSVFIRPYKNQTSFYLYFPKEEAILYNSK